MTYEPNQKVRIIRTGAIARVIGFAAPDRWVIRLGNCTYFATAEEIAAK